MLRSASSEPPGDRLPFSSHFHRSTKQDKRGSRHDHVTSCPELLSWSEGAVTMVSGGVIEHGVTVLGGLASGGIGGGGGGCSAAISAKMVMRLLMPMRYPSSWLPTTQDELWSIFIFDGSSSVLAKSISHTLAFFWSWTKSNELPII